MSTGVGLPNLDKLNENNYDTWKMHMKDVLMCNDLWGYFSSTEQRPEQNTREWMKKDAKALAIIQLRVSPSQLNYVKKAETSKQACDALRMAFESSGPIRKVTLYKQLLRTKKVQNSTMTEHDDSFSDIADRLPEAGLDIPQELLSIMLLSSLPEARYILTSK